MRRYWRVYRTFFVSSFVRELEFKANFFAKIAQNTMWIFFFVMILLVVFRNTDNVAGWTRGDAYILAASVFLMNAVSSAFFNSLNEIPQQVRTGTLDFVVTKPIDSQFWISSRKFNFDQIGTLLAGTVMVAVGVLLTHIHPSFLQWASYLVLLVSSLAIFYSFTLSLMTTGIWLVRVDNLFVLTESMVQVARYPMDIYGAGLQKLFTYAVPLGFLATIPARQLVRGFDAPMLGLGIVWGLVAVMLSRLFWKFAMRHYTSASS